MKKRILSALLCLAMVISMVPFGVFAEGEEAEEPVIIEEPIEEEVLPEEGEEVIIAEPEEEEAEEPISMAKVAVTSSLNVMYTGSAVEPYPWLKYNSESLVEGRDYTISYKNNINAADAYAVNSKGVSIAPTMIITGKGRFTGKISVPFTINPRPVSIDSMDNKYAYSYTGKPIKLNLNLKNGYGKAMKQDKDYILRDSYGNTVTHLTLAGEYKLYIVGMGNYTDSRMITVTISNNTPISKCKIAPITPRDYSTTCHKPVLTITDPKTGRTLVKDKDYTVVYPDGPEVGTLTVTVWGKGEYFGRKDVKFTVRGTSMSKVTVSVPKQVVYGPDLFNMMPEVSVTRNGSTVKLNYGSDYGVSVDYGKQSGTLTVYGLGAYTGKKTVTYKIRPFNAQVNLDERLDISVWDVFYGEQPKNAGFSIWDNFTGDELIEGRDFTLSVANNTQVRSSDQPNPPTLTFKFKGYYTGTVIRKYSIVSDSIQSATFNDTPHLAYNGKSGGWKQAPVLRAENGMILKAGVDYDKNVAYFSDYARTKPFTDENAAAGATVYMTVAGKGGYTGTKNVSYRLTQASLAKAVVKIKAVEYKNGQDKPSSADITVTLNGKTLKYNTDFVVSNTVAPKATGTGKLTILGTGNYGGMKTVSYKVVASKIELPSGSFS